MFYKTDALFEDNLGQYSGVVELIQNSIAQQLHTVLTGSTALETNIINTKINLSYCQEIHSLSSYEKNHAE